MHFLIYGLMVLGLASLLPWIVMAPMSLMSFDDGFNVSAVAFVGAMFLYPVWLIGWDVAAYRALRSGRSAAALRNVLLGVIPALAIAGLFWWHDTQQSASPAKRSALPVLIDIAMLVRRDTQ